MEPNKGKTRNISMTVFSELNAIKAMLLENENTYVWTLSPISRRVTKYLNN